MSIKQHLEEMILFKEDSINESSNKISNDALVRLSLLSLGSDLPFPDSDKVTAELVKLDFLNDSLGLTDKANKYLKDKKVIKRLKEIGE